MPNNSKFVLVNFRGNIIPMTPEEYDEYLHSDRSWIDDVFSN